MTKQEALEILDTIPTIGEQVDALEMAIEALEKKPSEDCISRQAAIDEMGYCQTYLFDTRDKDKKISLEDALYALEQLSSAQPKRGKWIDKVDYYVCSECGKRMPYAVLNSEFPRAYEFMSDYCPHCGSAMEVESDGE